MTTTKRVTVAAILKAIGCKYLSLYKGKGYYYFSYDNLPSAYETHSVDAMYALNRLTLEQWISEGRDFVTRMETAAAQAAAERSEALAAVNAKILKALPPVEAQPGDDVLALLRARREALSREPNGCYLNQHEMQELWDREQEIERGQEAMRRAAFYFEHIKENRFDRTPFATAFFTADKDNGF